MYDIGRASYGNIEVLQFGGDATLRIGSYCSLAKGTKILLGGEHRADWVTTYPFNVLSDEFSHIVGARTKGDVTIGHDVWIARDVTVLSGVSIGDGAVVGAGTVVTRDVPPYCIIAGNPGKTIRMRFSKEIVEALLAIRWWEWKESRISRAVPYLLQADAAAFVNKVRSGEL